MTIPVAETVAPDVKADKIAANVDNKTPDVETPPIVDKAPDPPRPDEDGLDALREQVASLGATVNTLAETVGTLVERVAATVSDVAPRKLPWTHYGSHNGDQEGR